jgi:hypothetical protein
MGRRAQQQGWRAWLLRSLLTGDQREMTTVVVDPVSSLGTRTCSRQMDRSVIKAAACELVRCTCCCDAKDLVTVCLAGYAHGQLP